MMRTLRKLVLKLKKQTIPPDVCPACRWQIDGHCRRWPPVVYQFGKVAAWPHVTEDMWCGEFKDA